VEIANCQINRRRWRGAFGGVLPDGYDANAIAAEAVADLLKDRRKRNLPELPVLRQRRRTHAFPIPHSELSILRSTLISSVESQAWTACHRKENSLSNNRLAPILDFDGELVSVVETLPAQDLTRSSPAPQEDAEVKAFRTS
jgi:hypothetical protein